MGIVQKKNACGRLERLTFNAVQYILFVIIAIWYCHKVHVKLWKYKDMAMMHIYEVFVG